MKSEQEIKEIRDLLIKDKDQALGEMYNLMIASVEISDKEMKRDRLNKRFKVNEQRLAILNFILEEGSDAHLNEEFDVLRSRHHQ